MVLTAAVDGSSKGCGELNPIDAADTAIARLLGITLPNSHIRFHLERRLTPALHVLLLTLFVHMRQWPCCVLITLHALLMMMSHQDGSLRLGRVVMCLYGDSDPASCFGPCHRHAVPTSPSPSIAKTVALQGMGVSASLPLVDIIAIQCIQLNRNGLIQTAATAQHKAAPAGTDRWILSKPLPSVAYSKPELHFPSNQPVLRVTSAGRRR